MDRVGNLPGYGTVWYEPTGIANILSMLRATKKFCTLLFCEKLLGDLDAYGFRINPYDQCGANKMIGGKQLTVCWHVDGIKI